MRFVRIVALLELGYPKIENFDDVELGQKYVVGLQIAVNNALGVGLGKTARHLTYNGNRLLGRNASSSYPFAQFLSVEEFHGYKKPLVRGFAQIKQVNRVGMGKVGDDLGFAKKTHHYAGVHRKHRREHLEGNLAIHIHLASHIDLGHPARRQK